MKDKKLQMIQAMKKGMMDKEKALNNPKTARNQWAPSYWGGQPEKAKPIFMPSQSTRIKNKKK